MLLDGLPTSTEGVFVDLAQNCLGLSRIRIELDSIDADIFLDPGP